VTFLAADTPAALVAVTEMVPDHIPKLPSRLLQEQPTEPFDPTETYFVLELDAQVHVEPQPEACSMPGEVP